MYVRRKKAPAVASRVSGTPEVDLGARLPDTWELAALPLTPVAGFRAWNYFIAPLLLNWTLEQLTGLSKIAWRTGLIFISGLKLDTPPPRLEIWHLQVCNERFTHEALYT